MQSIMNKFFLLRLIENHWTMVNNEARIKTLEDRLENLENDHENHRHTVTMLQVGEKIVT